ncbi:MAG: hypothetical protein AMQ22_01863 [Candidatus Methanofastidiosum methylothiophilum]|uniref:Uncharacterized protein n=1 Tax=Candidatus Methanofastidiosum methylothiophilum TaxID=1705564 RepID=A0A150IUB6_9EURY|nr:MAG: hypothetical protein AMQ22_01863 [Candidatus Methanofastidiosum methylthiophilus]
MHGLKMASIVYLYLAIANFFLLLIVYSSLVKNKSKVKYLYALGITEVLWVVLYIFPFRRFTSDFVDCIVKLI